MGGLDDQGMCVGWIVKEMLFTTVQNHVKAHLSRFGYFVKCNEK